MTGSPASSEAQLVPLRCPVPPYGCQPGRLLANLRITGERPQYIHPDNLIEMSCHACVLRYRKAGRSVKRVLHRYSFIGDLVETLVEEDNAEPPDAVREA